MRTIKKIATGLFLSMVVMSAHAQSPKHGHGKQHAHKMHEELGLTKDQSSQMKAIHEKYHPQIKAIRENESLTKEVRQAQIKPLKDAKDAELKTVLTTDQYAALKEMKSQHKKGDHQKALMASLNLTESQELQMKAINEKYRPQMKAIKDDHSLDQEAKKSKLKPLKKAQRADVRNILTKEQFDTYQAHKKKGRRHHKK